MLSEEAKKTLEEAGFTKMEIGIIDRSETKGTPQQTDISAGVWQSAIESRKTFVGRMADEGLDAGDTQDMVDEYYAGEGEATPWDFIKIEYKPAKKLADFAYATAQRALKRVDSHFGEGYRKR